MSQPKTQLRHQILATLGQQDACARRLAGEQVAAHLANWVAQNGQIPPGGIALFKSLSTEIDTEPLRAWLESTQAPHYWPRANPDDCSLNFVHAHGQDDEPVALEKIALLLVPGLAFDKQGRRLGRGKGYYDRFLADFKALPHKPMVMGLALDCQVIDQIPVDSHDQGVDMLCSPSLGVCLTS